MAPGYNNYSNYWDPANSQAQNQQGYSYASQTNTTPQYSDSRAANANQQTSSYADTYANANTYGRGWYDTNTQQSSAADNRAVESLGHLNNQDNAYATGARSTATPAYASSSWSTAQYPAVSASTTSNASQARDIATSIASPQTTYSTARPTSAYSSTQSYQRPESTTSYSQAAYNNASAQYRESQSKVTSPPTTYTHATHSQATTQPASTTPATSQYTTPATSQYSTVPARTSTASQFRPSSPYQPQTHARQSSTSQSASTTDKGWAAASKPSSQAVRQTQSNQNYPRSITPSQVHQQAQDAHRNSTSAEPSNLVTVDPTQVYDPWPEQQRKAQAAAEQRRKMEAEKAKKEAEQQEIERKRREEEEKKAAEEAARVQAEADKDKLEAAHGLAMAAAAMSAEAAAGGDMEAQMRAPFQKMREFNAKDPNMLARLWEEERQQHVASGSPIPSAQPSAGKTAGSAGASSSSAQASATTPSAKAKPSSAKKAKAASKAKAKSTPTQAQPPAAPSPAVSVPTTVSSAAPPPVPASVAVPPVVPAPATTQSGQAATTSTIWPHGKKTQIAQAAAKWLNERNEASGKTVRPSDVFLMLDSNPSYTTLCESLEGLGLIVDRGPFARALLHAVPDISRSQSSQNAQANPAPVQKIVDAAQAPASASTQSTMAKSAAKRKDRSDVASPAPGAPNSSQAQWTQPIPATAPQSLVDMYRSAVDTPAHAQAPSQAGSPVGSAPPASKNSTGAQSPYFPQPPRPPPRNKEEAARKRNFSELVDLTAADDSDNDDIPPPPKQPNLSQFGMSTLSPPADLDAAPQAPMNTRQAPSFAHQGVPSMADKLKNQILVQPIVRSKVARKSRYDPRTIARDVLLATGRHPSMRALNQHLMGLQELLMTHSEGVELNKFDLSTIRWDLIDPGDPVVEVEEDEKSEEDVDADDEGDGMPAPVRTMQRMDHGDGTVSAVEIRTPAPTLKGMGAIKKARGRPATAYDVQSRGRPPKAYTDQSRGPPYSVPIQTNSLGPGQPVNQPSSASGQRAPRNTATHIASWMTPQDAANFTRASTNQSDSGSPAVGYAAFKASQVQYDQDGNPIKRRGRPVGWRKAIHSRAANGLEGGQTSAHNANGAEQSHSEKVGQGRKKGHRKPAPFPEPDPQFNVYECKFRACKAQLHNLDTMKKHVVKVHGVPNKYNKYQCDWMFCRADGGDASGKCKWPANNPAMFDTIQEWAKHLEVTHFLDVARALGDGPRGGLSDHYDSEASEAYMSDATGRIVTPRATPMESLAEDAEQQSQPLAPINRRGMPRVRGVMSEEQRKDELKLQHLEARRLRVGPGMDRTGVRFVTEERRAGLYDDEEFEGAFSPDDGPEDDDDDE
ncbi:hypothetical protein MBLNU457_5528t1 [Dothideomycetes sp. NU457]